MKTWNIEIQKVRAMAHGNGLIRAQIDALVQPASAREDAGMAASVLSLSEDNARVLVLLLKQQLAELDSRKAKSRR
ncbi:MAG: hypothetical protein M3O01_14540 [Pseudomonadota bacterium]|nr:hypothetical protein [Pseudomonadota bacterium]